MSYINRFNALDVDYDDNWRTIGSHGKSTVSRSYNSTNICIDKKCKKDNKNYKKMLCENMVLRGSCNYGTRCNYAHNLNEQIIETSKKQAYDIIRSDNNLSHINLQKDLLLYKTLMGLGKICESCEKRKCTGGFNCKFGTCDKSYQICTKDLNTGDCIINCGYIHLTKRGLIPFYGNTNSYECLKNNSDNNMDEELLNNLDSLENIYNLSDNECDKSIFE